MRKRVHVLLGAGVVAVVMLVLGTFPTRAEEYPPNPINPSTGEAELLQLVNAIPINDIQKALDNFPVPYVVVAKAGNATQTIKSNKAGAPTKVDADRSKKTGDGGNDIQVEVNTELTPEPHLRLNINRIGAAPYATDLSVLVAFPFDAFNTEDASLPSDPNLFFGYHTTGNFDATTQKYPIGGVAPASLEYRFRPGVLAGTNHLFDLSMNTVGASNPVRFISGEFDGTAAQGVKNAFGAAAHADPVPANINLSVGTSETLSNLDPSALTETDLELNWTASAPARVEFDFLEDESFPFTIPDFNTTLTFDKMPTSETIALGLDEGDDGPNGLHLTHTANAPIDKITFLKQREDGLTIRGVAREVPTNVTIGADLDGGVTLDVNANTMDLTLDAMQTGGFFQTADFLGYDVGLLHAGATNVPDLTATLDPASKRYIVQATNAGESIDSIELVLDDGPLPVIGGAVDVNRNGAIGSDDDGPFGGYTIVDGKVDVDGSGAITAADDIDVLPGLVPESEVIDGQIDLDRNNVINGFDTAPAAALALPPTWTEPDLRHVLSLTDDGTAGTVAGRLVKVTGGQLDLDGQAVIDGALDMNNDGAIDTNDDGLITLDLNVIDGAVDRDGSGAITTSDDGTLYATSGATIIDGLFDMNNDGVINASDDGGLTSTVFGMGTTAEAPLQGVLNTKSTSKLFPGRDVSVVCSVEDVPAGNVEFNFESPPPVLAIEYLLPVGSVLDKVKCSGHIGALLFEQTLDQAPAGGSVQFIPDQSLTVVAHDGHTPPVPNSARYGAATVHFCDDPNLDSVCDEDDPAGTGIPSSSNLFGTPLYDAWARIDDTPSFEGKWRQAPIDVTDSLLQSVNVNFGGVNLIGGKADVNDDGAITGADDGRFLGKRVVDGGIDMNDDGAANGNDDGTLNGTVIGYDTGSPDITDYLAGVQVDVSTTRGLPEPAVADASLDDYARFVDKTGTKALAAGVFGIDDFQFSVGAAERGVALRYGANEAHELLASFETDFGNRYFPAYAADLDLKITDVPATFSFFSDLATEAVYSASSPIEQVKLTGTLDGTNDSNANGTTVGVQLDDLPSQIAWHLAADVTNVAAGVYDVGDKVVGGTRFVGGKADVNNDGLVTPVDDGFFVGVPVIDGGLDVDENGSVNGDDNGAVAGSTLAMSNDNGNPSITIDLSSPDKVIETDYRRIDLDITDIPAQWAANWGGSRFLIESKNAAGQRSAMGQVSGIVSMKVGDADNLALRAPFMENGPDLSGPVLDAAPGATNGCRIDYSNFAQTVDFRYYSEGQTSVLERLQELYCDSEALDSVSGGVQDHAVVRMGDANGDGKEDLEYGSLQFTGFQRVSFTPDANGGQFILRAPTSGDHPLYAGYESNDKYTTVEVQNIPDEVIVDIDKTEHVTYDAHDATNASFGEIDLYSGPLPIAGDGDDATRVIVRPTGGTDPTPTESYIHAGWGFEPTSGGAFVDNSDELEVMLLTQDGTNRITAGITLEDLLAGYALDLFSFDVSDSFCILPDPFGGCIVEIPVAWELFEAKAGIVNAADGFTPAALGSMSPDTLTPDPNKPDVAGFLAVYTHEAQGDLQAIDGGPSPGSAGEYVPMITAAEKGFRGITASLKVSLDPLSPNVIFPFSVDVSVDTENVGQVLFDFWTTEGFTFTDDDAIPGIDEVGITNKPDYVDNKPFHILPGLFSDPTGVKFDNEYANVYSFVGWHRYNSHFDPYGA